MKSLKATTINTIPALRALANDVIFDVLMYLTPGFCYEVLECVTDQIDTCYKMIQKVHSGFVAGGGKCSLVGHSLGSVICWDILAILKVSEKGTKHVHGVQVAKAGQSFDVGYQHYANEENANVANNGSWGPSLSKPLNKCLPFVPDFTLFLGSPIGLFLTLRGAHAVFDELRDPMAGSTEGEKPRVSPFTLPSGSIYNIFHPSDPVAYRIEPLLLAQDADVAGLPPPLYLTRHGQGVRLHIKAIQIGDEIRKSLIDTTSTLSMFMTKVQEQASTMLKQIDDHAANEQVTSKDKEQSHHHINEPLKFPLGGRSHRVDYQLQPKVIDNDYVSAVTAHSSYFSNTDIHDAIMDLTMHNKTELQVDQGVADPL